ncbi:class III lanthionine synthetase LanKC [Actinomadura sp. HBU206391]|uniref:class III lanthionine synthetase LanKC n=1 Tax=Actinomadura sp. HBU206391 TaxID=2731692 RepID=UPI00164EE593|nr:class III lanthionine synthetase LanKC [Actinomadura sp. HBU206391]MBC6458466.1 protein kinase/lanthionine synthetase C family protein [Actinomadura sp. HBU206391]
MDKRYELYCMVDPLFYDSPVAPQAGSFDYPIAGREVPAGWQRFEQDDWLVYGPDESLTAGVELPGQGWKIHVSACLGNAEEILDEVWDYCVPHLISFKFLRAAHVLHMRNAKYASRGASGKLVTIYPENEKRLELVLTELGDILAGRPGPYILSDLRWGEGPLYVRYGGFAPRYCVSDRGVLEPAIEDPDGRLVPDRRTPVFTMPPWVELPACLEPHLKARSATTVQGLPYKVERVLHFSNGGGVYAGRDLRTGDEVVLKEARPHAGLAYDGADAVTRLAHERAIMEALAGLDAVPAVRDHFTLGEHHFLVQDLIEGKPLNQMFSERYPLSDPTQSSERTAEYTEWALGVYQRVEQAIEQVHERGYVFGDLHPFNIMVRPDDSVALIDYEVAAPVAEAERPSLAHPGFAAPNDRKGFERDRYALACLRLALFLPITTLLVLDRAKASHFAEIVADNFPVPRDFLDEAVEIIDPAERSSGPVRGAGRAVHEPTPEGWERARASMSRAILASATPGRDDRLFPGDIEQFATGGMNISHGAAGVLYALDVTGAGRHPEHEEWLIQRALTPREGTRLGFYEGLHGIAYVLEHLGHRDEALKIVEICLGEKWEGLGLDLGGGLAGVGLNLRHFAQRTGDSTYREAAVRAAEIVADRLGDVDDVPEISGGDHPYAGLFEGSSGPALLFIRMFEDTGDQAWLDHAAIALGQDLRRCTTRPDGTLHVNEGWRTVPYLNRGGAGIAVVLEEYLAQRDDERFRRAAEEISRGVRSPFTVQSGLFNGRAGLLAYLARGHEPGRAGADPDVALQVRNLAWHALTYQGDLAFPGDQLYRLSMDLATGTAGVLLAVGAALHGEPVALPLLEPSTIASRRSEERRWTSNGAS